MVGIQCSRCRDPWSGNSFMFALMKYRKICFLIKVLGKKKHMSLFCLKAHAVPVKTMLAPSCTLHNLVLPVSRTSFPTALSLGHPTVVPLTSCYLNWPKSFLSPFVLTVSSAWDAFPAPGFSHGSLSAVFYFLSKAFPVHPVEIIVLQGICNDWFPGLCVGYLFTFPTGL